MASVNKVIEALSVSKFERVLASLERHPFGALMLLLLLLTVAVGVWVAKH